MGRRLSVSQPRGISIYLIAGLLNAGCILWLYLWVHIISRDLLEKGINMESSSTMEKPFLDLDDVRKLQSEAVARMNMIRSDNNNVIDRYMEALFQLEENDVILSDRKIAMNLWKA